MRNPCDRGREFIFATPACGEVGIGLCTSEVRLAFNARRLRLRGVIEKWLFGRPAASRAWSRA